MGGAYLYCHVEALADVADLRLELICVCLVRSLLTPHEQETLFCMDTVLCLFTRAPHPTAKFFFRVGSLSIYSSSGVSGRR